MLLLTALGAPTQIRAAADELDRHDPSPADAVSWFEEKSGKFRIEIYVPTEQDADSARAIVGAAAPELHLVEKAVCIEEERIAAPTKEKSAVADVRQRGFSSD